MIRNLSGKFVSCRNPCGFLLINSFKYQTKHFNSFNQSVHNQNIKHLIASPSVCLHSKTLTNSSIRYYSSNEANENDKIPTKSKIPILSDEPIVVTFPSIFRNIINIYKSFKVRANYEPTFYVREFLEGARIAAGVISSKLANGDIDGLRGLVTDDLLKHLQEIIKDIPAEKLKELYINADDILKQTVRYIDIIESNERTFIEIFVIQYVCKNVSALDELDFDKIPKNAIGYVDENLQVLNYKFIKEVTKGVEDDWTVNLINHVKLDDAIAQQKEAITKTFQEFEKMWKDKK